MGVGTSEPARTINYSKNCFLSEPGLASFVYFRSFFKQHFSGKAVVFSGIRTRIVVLASDLADQLIPIAALDCLKLNSLIGSD